MTPRPLPRVAIVGAGIAGLAAALRLSHAGCDVQVFERHGAPGGKMRTVASPAGPIDAGPTVLTMRPVFDALFADVGENLDDHITLTRDAILARHYWPDGAVLDLTPDRDESAANIAAAFGPRAAVQFRAFAARAARLYDGFAGPVMHAARPTLPDLVAHVLRRPRLLRDLGRGRSLAGSLRAAFDEPRLAQLFGRYATYVGGSPYRSPAILALIWQAEAAGVWRAAGGMHRLAAVIAALAAARGARFRYDAHVARIELRAGRVAGVVVDGRSHPCNAVVYNGDPAALRDGALGLDLRRAVPPAATAPRSLSACVLAFAARPTGPPLAHHTVFFGADPSAEFTDLAAGRLPGDPTLYICDQDARMDGAADRGESALHRYEIIMNAPPTGADGQRDATCATSIITTRLARFGLTFDPPPTPADLTTPQDFAQMFPGSRGSLYGRSPHGTLAAFARPTAATRVPGLVLAGGGAHPGAGVPMATISARHAAATILAGRTSTSASRPAATAGGMSTASPTTASAASRSSPS